MTCEGYQEQVSQLIDNELGERESPALFGHLSMCAECRGFLHTTFRLRSGLQEHGPLLAPTHLDEKVLGPAIVKKGRVPDRLVTPSILWKRRVSLPIPVAAAVIVLLMLGSIALSSLWFRDSEAGFQTQTIYVTTLPTVEVQGYYP
ncbi:MAG: zf-HC2 domain-containing protein, partial [Bacteroidota bacterium]